MKNQIKNVFKGLEIQFFDVYLQKKCKYVRYYHNKKESNVYSII